MTALDPSERPTVDKAKAQFQAILDKQHGYSLRWCLKAFDDGRVIHLFDDISSVGRECNFLLQRLICKAVFVLLRQRFLTDFEIVAQYILSGLLVDTHATPTFHFLCRARIFFLRLFCTLHAVWLSLTLALSYCYVFDRTVQMLKLDPSHSCFVNLRISAYHTSSKTTCIKTR